MCIKWKIKIVPSQWNFAQKIKNNVTLVLCKRSGKTDWHPCKYNSDKDNYNTKNAISIVGMAEHYCSAHWSNFTQREHAQHIQCKWIQTFANFCRKWKRCTYAYIQLAALYFRFINIVSTPCSRCHSKERRKKNSINCSKQPNAKNYTHTEMNTCATTVHVRFLTSSIHFWLVHSKCGYVRTWKYRMMCIK